MTTDGQNSVAGIVCIAVHLNLVGIEESIVKASPQLFKSYLGFCVVWVFTRLVRSQSTLQRQL
jgi:hypothetical protein